MININKITRWFGAVIFAATLGGIMVSSIPIQSVAAAPGCDSRFLGFPTWYRNLTTAYPECNIKSPADAGGLSTFIWHIGFNLVEIVLLAIVYIAAGYFIYGGFIFIISRGNPEKAAAARMTLLYAMVGFVISMAAVIIVNFVVDRVLK